MHIQRPFFTVSKIFRPTSVQVSHKQPQGNTDLFSFWSDLIHTWYICLVHNPGCFWTYYLLTVSNHCRWHPCSDGVRARSSPIEVKLAIDSMNCRWWAVASCRRFDVCASTCWVHLFRSPTCQYMGSQCNSPFKIQLPIWLRLAFVLVTYKYKHLEISANSWVEKYFYLQICHCGSGCH